MKLTGFEKLPSNTDRYAEINDKEYEFLQMLYSRDMDAETATRLLHISREEMNTIIRKLLVYEVLQYVSYDEIELTETGITILTQKNGSKKK